MSRLILVRHGDTALNSTERYWGKTDVELSQTGILQAESLRDRLAAEKIDAIYSSPLKRSYLTAKTIASGHHIDITVRPELQEINFGDFEGLTFSEISERYPDVVREWASKTLTFRYPNGESVDEFNNRVRAFFLRLDKHIREENIIIVAHSGVIRTLICLMLGLELERRWQLRTDLASLSIVEIHPDIAILNKLNDTSHLKAINAV